MFVSGIPGFEARRGRDRDAFRRMTGTGYARPAASLSRAKLKVKPWLTSLVVCFCIFPLVQPARAASGNVEIQAGVRAFYDGSDTSAWSHFSRAARAGKAEAYYWLGYMTELGLNTKQDLKKAAQLYARAAAAGWSMAKAKLGHLYFRGEGVTQDFAKARSLLEQAAHDNVADAQFDLGSIYEKGLGIPKDPIYAYVWYEFAARGGNPRYREARDRILKSMSFDQITEGQKILKSMRGSIFGLTAGATGKS